MTYFLIFIGICFVVSYFINKDTKIEDTEDIFSSKIEEIEEVEEIPLLEKPEVDEYANLTPEQRAIKERIETRNIKQILHFTQLRNLESILENGIIPRAQVIERNITSAFSDKDRADRHPEATCCSVSYPNYKMFWHVRCTHEEFEWVVIALSTDILLEKNCVFYPTNAASNEVRHGNVIDFKGAAAFDAMFAEAENKTSRAKMELPEKYPTNPQAEILVFDDIEKEYILAVYTIEKKTADEWNEKELGIRFIFQPQAFKPRRDYKYWKK